MRPAEQTSTAIAWLLANLGARGFDYVVREGLPRLPGHSGLYAIFAVYSAGSFPIYLGYTGRTFEQRFYEHFRGGSGVGSLIAADGLRGAGGFPLKPEQFTLYCLPADGVIAKSLESAFLSCFSFALNTSENEGVRPLRVPWQDHTAESELSAEDIDAIRVFRETLATLAGMMSEFHGALFSALGRD